MTKPETSIIIRTFNEEKHLGNLLRAIETQKYRKAEVIVVDSGSTDRTLEIARSFPVRVIEISKQDFTFGYALNVGCRTAKGKYLVIASAHVLPVDKHWLGNLVACFDEHDVAMVYGRQVGAPQSKFSETRDFNRLFGTVSENVRSPLSYPNNANSAVRRDMWERYPFDEYLFGLEDIDFARRVTTDDFVVHYEPSATVYHIHEERWPQVFNRYRREAIAAVRIGLAKPPQTDLSWSWLIIRLISDVGASFPNWSRARIEEILRFRYYQWKGSRVGWGQGAHLQLDTDKNSVFYPDENVSVVITGPHEAELKEVSLEKMKPGDLLLKVEYVGVCRTDLEVFERTLGYYRDGVAQYPIVPGHEFSGTIVRVGSNNRYQERFKVGQRVVGECVLSRDPSGRKEVGVINYNGAYSTYIVVPGHAVHKVPYDVDSKKAALAEPLAVVLRAIRRVQHRLFPQAKVAVIGVGTIGYLCAEALLQDGYEVTVFDKNPDRLAYLNGRVHAVSLVLEGVDRFDVIFEVTGSREVLEEVIKQSRSGSTLMMLGFPYGNINYNFEDLVGKEKFFAGSVGGDAEDFVKALELLSKIEIPADAYTVLPLADFKQAWELHRASKHLKIFLQP